MLLSMFGHIKSHLIEQFCIGLGCIGPIPWKVLSKKKCSIGNLQDSLKKISTENYYQAALTFRIDLEMDLRYVLS